MHLFRMTHQLLAWYRSGAGHERGASLVEYALLAALIAVVCITAITVLGGVTSEKFSEVGRSVTNA